MEHQIKLTVDEVAEKLCRQLVAEGIPMTNVDIEWQVDATRQHCIITGVILTIKDQEEDDDRT